MNRYRNMSWFAVSVAALVVSMAGFAQAAAPARADETATAWDEAVLQRLR